MGVNKESVFVVSGVNDTADHQKKFYTVSPGIRSHIQKSFNPWSGAQMELFD
jgi:hypothetical protein